MNKKAQMSGSMIFTLLIIGILIIGIWMWGLPKYRVYSLELKGKAQLKQAEWNRQITIKEAEAELQSAELKRQADVIRSKGIAESNEIIAESLTTEYITWKWVEGLQDGSSEVIYVPTEANLPILEANRFR